ncbi:hypothetical protein VNO77_24698 [Canavalia gladiata]|uniref:Complex I assembly factor TIMMDC1, mitochondrial n=1 Tax=Canavalia gladiata TaxID=3824 RepID=A0AAN9LC40_CANGL
MLRSNAPKVVLLSISTRFLTLIAKLKETHFYTRSACLSRIASIHPIYDGFLVPKEDSTAVQSFVSTAIRTEYIFPLSFSDFFHFLISRQPNRFYDFHFRSFDFAAPPTMEVPDNSEATVRNNSPRLAGTVNWGTATVIGVFAGMLYGGSKEAAASVSKDAEVMLKLGSTEDKREQYRLMRDAMEKRFLRVTRGSIVGGVRLGMFTAAFYGMQNLLAEKRGVHDVYNVVGAGSATASAFGLIMPGSFLWRARNMALGSVLGAAFCFPLGWVHLKLVEMANEGNPAAHPNSDQREVKGGVSAAIERLEENLSK